jgi:hypothetical protein
MIEVERTIFAFKFSKKYDLSLLSIEGRVLDRCRLASVDAHLWYRGRQENTLILSMNIKACVCTSVARSVTNYELLKTTIMQKIVKPAKTKQTNKKFRYLRK